MIDDELPNRPKSGLIDFYSASVEELEERILQLKEEILRCEAAISSKKATKDAANALFGNQKG